MADDARVQELVERVQRGSKYANIHPGLIARIGRDELAIRRNLKEAVKTTRRKLHQVGAVYMTGRQPYEQWLDALRRAHARNDADEIRAICQQAMASHQSSRERLPILERFYGEVLHSLAPVESVLDLACGLNPMAIPWMPLVPGARYAAHDIYTDLMAFLQDALPLLGVQGEAAATDLIAAMPTGRAQVALLLKSIPCLEQLDRDAGARLLEQIPARHIVVSFPLQSLGGRRDRGMPTHYEARFDELTAGRGWEIERHAFETELVFVVHKERSES